MAPETWGGIYWRELGGGDWELSENGQRKAFISSPRKMGVSRTVQGEYEGVPIEFVMPKGYRYVDIFKQENQELIGTISSIFLILEDDTFHTREGVDYVIKQAPSRKADGVCIRNPSGRELASFHFKMRTMAIYMEFSEAYFVRKEMLEGDPNPWLLATILFYYAIMDRILNSWRPYG